MGAYKDTKFADFKRRAILDAALAEFEAKGPERASMRAIASGAGVTTGAIYSMFDGKSAIYSALLAESLARLNAFVTERAEAAQNGTDALRASIQAFFDYYVTRSFEVQLGLHAFDGIRPASLGPEQDAALNAALLETLDIIGTAIADVAPHLTSDSVRAERDAIFSCLIGALALAHTGRAQSIGTTPEAIMSRHIEALTERLQSA